MRSFGGLVRRFIAVLCCASILIGAISISAFADDVGIERRPEAQPKIELVVEAECGRGCTFILTPEDQKAISAGGIAAWTAIAARACGMNLACNAAVVAGAALATEYVTEYGSDTCDMHIRIRPTGVTTAVVVTHELRCAGKATPAR
jgi:hypothetical protein